MPNICVAPYREGNLSGKVRTVMYLTKNHLIKPK